ncbi:MAG: VWA domain-containing protein [Cyclobacteriaceae bacterium]
MQRLQFESSSYFILLCIALGVGYAFILYRSKHSWGKRVNQLLFGLRACLVALLAFLLIGPILKLTTNLFEKPALVFLIDNSTSVKEAVDSVSRAKIGDQLQSVKEKLEKQGYEVKWNNLANQAIEKINFNNTTSDLSWAIRGITTEYEGKNLAGIVLLSDGVYNSGTSPLYSPIRVPVYSIGVGDTTERMDLKLKNVAYNKITYQGNKFPIRAEVIAQGISNQEVTISVFKNGKLLAQQKKNLGAKPLIDFDFLIDATEKGMQRLDVLVDPLKGESNIKNNRASVFVEVVEGRKKIILIAPAPHPDIKAIRTVVEKNSNYEFILHIPGVTDATIDLKSGGELIIFHQALDVNGKTAALFQQFKKSKASILFIIGNQSNLRQLTANSIPFSFEQAGQWDEVTPVVNAAFRDFNFLENSNGVFSKYPPVEVPFGKFTYPPNANVLLYQRIGSVATDRPLLLSWEEDNRKLAAIVGEGIWKWRLNEFATNENTEVFDDVFSKLIQYLSTLDDKRKFKSFPIQNEFSDAVPVTIESQVYNELFELVYGNKVELELRDEQNKITKYEYVLSPGGTRYQIGGLKEGVYQYKSSTALNGKREEVRGQFLVTAQNIESQNLTADFGLLSKLSASTGGKFYSTDQLEELSSDFEKVQASSLIHSDESFNPLINLKWVFFLLLTLISIEWFLRKYLGGY